jgi:hypothetical protein
MPWPPTLAPTNEAIKCDNRVEKKHNKEKKIRIDLGGHARCKDGINIKKA